VPKDPTFMERMEGSLSSELEESVVSINSIDS